MVSTVPFSEPLGTFCLFSWAVQPCFWLLDSWMCSRFVKPRESRQLITFPCKWLLLLWSFLLFRAQPSSHPPMLDTVRHLCFFSFSCSLQALSSSSCDVCQLHLLVTWVWAHLQQSPNRCACRHCLLQSSLLIAVISIGILLPNSKVLSGSIMPNEVS